MVRIPIVMATDERYIPLIVSITSMIKNAAEDTFYDIYILIDDSFGKESQGKVENCLHVWGNKSSVSFINVGHVFDHVSTNIPHITRPTYFRLLLPELLHEEKCIYLDTDTIILSDLQALFHVRMEECYIAGVWHPGVMFDGWEEGIIRTTHLSSADQYINAGVLVMNLEMMRRDRLTERFLELIPEGMPNQDQDIINCACYGKIELLPFKYNVMTKLANRCAEDYRGTYSETDLQEAWNKPCIIHYADPNKPWNSTDSVFMDYWWYYFGRTSVCDGVMKQFINDLAINIIYSHCNDLLFKKKMPKIFDFAYDRKYVIYGAGKRAGDVLRFMKQREITPDFIMVSDEKGNPKELEGIAVKGMKEAGQLLEDKTIIIAVRESWQKAIIKNLQGYDYLELLPISDRF